MKKYIFASFVIALALGFTGLSYASETKNSEELRQASIHYYQDRYQLKNTNEKRVDNHGKGDENLYGVRNFRAVLNGVIYRGGANNDYNKYHRRETKNPLPPEGLKNLCKEGFGTAVYMYSTNFEKADPRTRCETRQGTERTLRYMQESPHLYESARRNILTLVHNKLTTDKDPSPIYIHCWNGWHAAGLISAMILRQFCDYTSAQAVQYWNLNTDGANKKPRYEKFRRLVREFKPIPGMKIDEKTKTRICPRPSSSF